MPRIKPYQGTSHDRLSQLIRNAQQPPLPLEVSFIHGDPRRGPYPGVGSTTLDTRAVTAIHTDIPVAVNYDRLSVEALQRLPAGELLPFDMISFPTWMHDILPKINEAIGLNLSTDEVLDVELLEIPDNGFTITITEASVAWLPGEYLLTYAPNSILSAGRGVNGAIPTDEKHRIRILENPIA